MFKRETDEEYTYFTVHVLQVFTFIFVLRVDMNYLYMSRYEGHLNLIYTSLVRNAFEGRMQSTFLIEKEATLIDH